MAKPNDPRAAKAILVIRLGALGDFVMSFGPFAAIRAHHPNARITLLTTPAFARLGRLSPWFDDVIIDRRAPWWDLRALLKLRAQLRGYDFVYDLQTSGRSSRYFTLAGRPPWSGIAQVPVAPTDWLLAAAHPPEVPRPYALMVPGASAHRIAKRWPTILYARLAVQLAKAGLTPVVIGTGPEASLAKTISDECPEAVDLTGRTDLPGLAALAAGARFAIGNDTGPMHLAAAMGCPCVTLFSYASDLTRTQPRSPAGTRLVTLREDNLADLSLDEVLGALTEAALI
jgi:ADP-heptose:LPS heptosyltransferase